MSRRPCHTFSSNNIYMARNSEDPLQKILDHSKSKARVEEGGPWNILVLGHLQPNCIWMPGQRWPMPAQWLVYPKTTWAIPHWHSPPNYAGTALPSNITSISGNHDRLSPMKQSSDVSSTSKKPITAPTQPQCQQPEKYHEDELRRGWEHTHYAKILQHSYSLQELLWYKRRWK